MMLKFINNLVCLLCTSNLILAQVPTSDENYRFAESLYINNKFSLALAESKLQFQQTPNSRLHLFINKCYFKLKRYENITCSSYIITDSSLYNKDMALYFGTRCYIDTIMPLYVIEDKRLDDYKHLYMRLYFLKQKKYDHYVSDITNYQVCNPGLLPYSSEFDKTLHKYQRTLNKKPFTAAFLSAIVPGLGKVYADRPREIIGPLLKSIALGLIAFEGYKKNGVHSFQFYTFGALYLFNYSSSIYGSYNAVKTNKQDFENRYYDELSKNYRDITGNLIQ